MSDFLGLDPRSNPAPGEHVGSTVNRAADSEGASSRLRPLRKRLPASSLPNPILISPTEPCPPNKTMLQGFEWYIPRDLQHWHRLTQAIPSLAALGVTSLWLPPACKAARPEGNGYDVYDLYDLGEFEQKGARATKWGPKEDLLLLGRAAADAGVALLFDAVLNHKAGADFSEHARAISVDPRDRRKDLGKVADEIVAWTGYNFPGRGDRYSQFKWNRNHFTGIDWDHAKRKGGVWRFEGKEWAGDVDEELGNYDYL